MSELIETKAAFARRLDLSRQAIQRHASTPGFPLTRDGKVRVEAALEWLEQNVRGHSPEAAEDDGGLIGARVRLLRVQTARAEISLAQERRESIPYSEARRALAAFMRMHRDLSLRFAVRYGPAIAAELGCDEGALIIALEMRMREALREALENARPFPRKDPAHEPA